MEKSGIVYDGMHISILLKVKIYLSAKHLSDILIFKNVCIFAVKLTPFKLGFSLFSSTDIITL